MLTEHVVGTVAISADINQRSRSEGVGQKGMYRSHSDNKQSRRRGRDGDEGVRGWWGGTSGEREALLSSAL